jgi:hypothetical protein
MSDDIQVLEPEQEPEKVEVTESKEPAKEPVQEEKKEPEAKEPEKPDQKELDKRAERKAYNQQKAWERLIEEKATLKAKVELYEQQQAQKQAAGDDVPKRDAYDSDESYVQALTDYKVDKRMATVKEELARSQSTSKVQESWASKVSKASQEYPDYQEALADAGDVPINPEVAEELMSSDLGGDIAYYLAKHPEEVGQLNRMETRSIARYVGRLEEKIEREKASASKVKLSKAPAPIKPASPSSASSIKNLEDMSMAEYVKYMDKQDALKRKR